MKVPDGSVVMGIPAKVMRPTTADDLAYIEHSLQSYVDLAAAHAAGRFARIS